MIARSAVRAGLALLFAATLANAQPQTPAPKPETATVVPAELPPDVAFGRFIALIRAHLATGDELVAQRDWRDAQQHVNFPREEIYGVIRDDLRTYKTPHFDGALKTLARAAQARNLKQYQGARRHRTRAYCSRRRAEDSAVGRDAFRGAGGD